MTVLVTLRIAATLEQVTEAELAEPGLYAEIIALAQAYGLISHRRVFREAEIMDIDEWESEEARASFREVALPLLERMRAARGSAPSTSETWHQLPEP